ncbi:MAG: hypothetical protein JST26_19140 [Bacteroidetes bacterium]|nr:hypothetical protein [Bacteroidota bacterium]
MIKRILYILPLIILLLVGYSGHARSEATDSSKIQLLIEEGIQKLKAQQAENLIHIEKKEYDQLNFIVRIGTGNTDNLISNTIPGTSSFISDSQKEQQLNQRLQTLYTSNQKQCYLLLISYFDVTVKGTPPDSLTIHDVFTTGKFYNENSDIQDWKWYQKYITEQIWNSSALNKTVPFYFISLGKYVGSFHKDQFLSYYYWHLKKNLPANASVPSYFNETYDYLLNYLKNGSFKDKNSDEKAEKFVAAYENSVKNAPLKAQIMSTYSASDLKNILAGFTQEAEYNYLTLNERLHILGVFVNSYMLGNWGIFAGTETFAVKTIKYTPPADVNALLNGLEAESVLNNDANYTGDKSNKDALIRRLISGIDDGVGSNYADLMSGINSIIEKAPEYDSWIAEMMSDDEYDKRLMNWGEGTDNYIKVNTVSVSDKAIVSITLDELEVQPCDTLNKGGSDERIVCLPGTWVSATPYTLRPFKLILFTNYSNLGAIDGATQAEKGTAKIVPAIYLVYSKDKELNYNIQKGISYTIDGLSLVSGVGTILTGSFKALSWGRKAWLIYNTGVAATNLYINATDMGSDPDFQDAYQIYTAVTVASGVGELTYNGVKNFSSCVRSTKNIINSTTQATKQQYLNLITKIDNVYAKLKSGTLTISAKGMASLRKMKAYSEKLKQNWTKLFKEPLPNIINNGPSTIFNKGQINTINGFSDNINALAGQNGLNLNTFKVLQQKRYDPLVMSPTEMAKIDAIRNSIPVPDGNTILQKVIPKSDISKYTSGAYTQIGGFISTAKDSKHLNTFEDIYYGMRLDYPNTKFSISDGSCGVIRYKTPNPSLTVPKLPETTGDLPFTGNGFTGGNNGTLGVPEWKSNYLTPQDGAELWEVFSDGSEKLRATFSSAQNKFIPVQ